MTRMIKSLAVTMCWAAGSVALALENGDCYTLKPSQKDAQALDFCVSPRGEPNPAGWQSVDLIIRWGKAGRNSLAAEGLQLITKKDDGFGSQIKFVLLRGSQRAGLTGELSQFLIQKMNPAEFLGRVDSAQKEDRGIATIGNVQYEYLRLPQRKAAITRTLAGR